MVTSSDTRFLHEWKRIVSMNKPQGRLALYSSRYLFLNYFPWIIALQFFFTYPFSVKFFSSTKCNTFKWYHNLYRKSSNLLLFIIVMSKNSANTWKQILLCINNEIVWLFSIKVCLFASNVLSVKFDRMFNVRLRLCTYLCRYVRLCITCDSKRKLNGRQMMSLVICCSKLTTDTKQSGNARTIVFS